MTDEAAFLRTVIERPDDDLCRLVFADWLDEHAQPARAEFIRVQCELAGMPQSVACNQPEKCYYANACEHGCGAEARDALRRREAELYDTSADWMLPHLPDAFAGVVIDPNELALCGDVGQIPSRAVGLLTRGFVSAVTLSWADWSRHAAALLAAAPIRRVNRAKPRICPHCSGEGCATHGHGDLSQPCDGSGELPAIEPDWRGDGLVRLTTWPTCGRTAGGGHIFQGRERGYDERELMRICERFTERTGIRSQGQWLSDLLALEYPGVAFSLPAAGDWDAPARSTPLADIQALRERVRRLGRPVGQLGPEARP